MDIRPSGAPNCTTAGCEGDGIYLCVQKPHENERYCPECLKRYIYALRGPIKTPMLIEVPVVEIPDNILPLKRRQN